MKKMIQTKFNHEIQCIRYVSYNLVRITNMYSISSGFFKLTIWKMTIFHWSLNIKQNLYIIFMVYFKFNKKRFQQNINHETHASIFIKSIEKYWYNKPCKPIDPGSVWKQRFFFNRKRVHICKALNIFFKKIAVSSSSPNLLSRAHAFWYKLS